MTMVGMTLGKSSPAMMPASERPERRAAAMKSALTRLSVAPRTVRAKNGMLTTMIASMALTRPGPSAATMASARSR